MTSVHRTRAGLADWLRILLLTLCCLSGVSGLLLLITAMLERAPIPATVAVVMLAAAVLAGRWAWQTSWWAAEERRTGQSLRDRNRRRALRPWEVGVIRVLLGIGPVVSLALLTTDRWLGVGICLLLQPILFLLTAPAHQRDQVLGRLVPR